MLNLRARKSCARCSCYYRVSMFYSPTAFRLSLDCRFCCFCSILSVCVLFSRLCWSLDVYPVFCRSFFVFLFCLLSFLVYTYWVPPQSKHITSYACYIGCCLLFVTLTVLPLPQHALSSFLLNLHANTSCAALLLLPVTICMYAVCLRFAVYLSLDCRHCCLLLL